MIHTVLLEKKYWKYVEIEAESEEEAGKIALKECDSPPKHIDDWHDYDNCVHVSG